MSTRSSTPAVSSDVLNSKDLVRALILDRQQPNPSFRPRLKAILKEIVTANDAVLSTLQIKGQNLQSQMVNLIDMLSKFVTANTVSTSSSGTLPGNTITNPKEDLTDLKDEEKAALLKVLKSHKRAIAWKLSDIKGVNPEFCTHKILMEEDYEPSVQSQRRIPIDPKDQEKTTFTCPYGTFAYRRMPFGLCNAPGTFQRCMMAIFHDMIEKTMEVFMDDFSVFGDSFSTCLSHLEKMLKRCEDTNLSLNWEKSHFMVKEGIVLGHKISKSGLEVDRAKVEVIAKLPHPTTVKGVRSFLGHAGFYRRFIQDFSKIARPMTHLLEKETPFFFSEECIESFNTKRKNGLDSDLINCSDWT
ncbi:reverse transcriptase domain-containing protein [Tanacetum coccineum]